MYMYIFYCISVPKAQAARKNLKSLTNSRSKAQLGKNNFK